MVTALSTILQRRKSWPSPGRMAPEVGDVSCWGKICVCVPACFRYCLSWASWYFWRLSFAGFLHEIRWLRWTPCAIFFRLAWSIPKCPFYVTNISFYVFSFYVHRTAKAILLSACAEMLVRIFVHASTLLPGISRARLLLRLPTERYLYWLSPHENIYSVCPHIHASTCRGNYSWNQIYVATCWSRDLPGETTFLLESTQVSSAMFSWRTNYVLVIEFRQLEKRREAALRKYQHWFTDILITPLWYLLDRAEQSWQFECGSVCLAVKAHLSAFISTSWRLRFARLSFKRLQTGCVEHRLTVHEHNYLSMKSSLR